MKLCAHRGSHGEFPENTLESFARAVEQGVEAIETDVRLTCDEVPVLFHDRFSPSRKPVCSITRSELSAEVGYHVPTLPEALGNWRDVQWLIELKSREVGESIPATLKSYRSARDIVVISFWHDLSRAVGESLEMDYGLTFGHCPGSIERPFEPSKHLRALVWNFEFVDAKTFQHASQAGLANYAYCVDSIDDYRRCLELQCDLVITDYPSDFLANSKTPQPAPGP